MHHYWRFLIAKPDSRSAPVLSQKYNETSGSGLTIGVWLVQRGSEWNLNMSKTAQPYPSPLCYSHRCITSVSLSFPCSPLVLFLFRPYFPHPSSYFHSVSLSLLSAVFSFSASRLPRCPALSSVCQLPLGSLFFLLTLHTQTAQWQTTTLLHSQPLPPSASPKCIS